MYDGNSLKLAERTGDRSRRSADPALLQELRKALGAIRYGSIELVIHDGRVVQLERHQKIRFEPDVSERSK